MCVSLHAGVLSYAYIIPSTLLTYDDLVQILGVFSLRRKIKNIVSEFTQPHIDILLMSLAFSEYTHRRLSVSSGGMRGAVLAPVQS